MKICALWKYPPIEGGVSSKSYWLAKGLGYRGHNIHVVTNSLQVENNFRELLKGDDLDYYQPVNVNVHNVDPFENPFFIPSSKAYVEKLASLCIKVINENNLNIIDSYYIIPYGIAGYIVSRILKIPHILRHAGSDITRLFESSAFNSLLTELIKEVDYISTYDRYKNWFVNYGVDEKKILLKKYFSIDTKSFNPNVSPMIFPEVGNNEIPVITYIGKFGKSKGVFEIFNALSKIEDDFIFILVSGGIDREIITKILRKYKLSKNTIHLGFIPPWKIPSLIKASTCVIHAEHDFPVSIHMPVIPREVMAVGKCIILSNEIYKKQNKLGLRDGDNVIAVDPKNIDEMHGLLSKIINNPKFAERIGSNALEVSSKIENFDKYLDSIEMTYSKILNN